jgi:hypothetical protein
VEAAFYGDSVQLIGTVGPSYGMARVTLDGQTFNVDFSAPSIYRNVAVWGQDLPYQPHTLKVEWTGMPGFFSSGPAYNYVDIDAIDVRAGALTPVYVPPTPPAPTRFEQDDPHLVYTGTWNTVASTSFSGGTYAYASKPGSAVEARFVGDYVQLIGTYGPSFGVARVTLDGWPLTIDLSSPTVSRKVPIWTQDVPYGPHTIRIEWTGMPGATSAGPAYNYVDLDAIDIRGEGLITVQ